MLKTHASPNVGLPLLINLVASITMLAVAHDRATNHALEFYPSTIPVMAQAGLCILVAIAGLVFRRAGIGCLLLSSMLLGTLFIPALYARFPGGDDGGGLGWLFIVVGGSVICFFVAIVTGMMAASIQSRSSHGKPPRHLSDSISD